MQDLWHSKVGQLLGKLRNLQKEGDEEISCDWPKYWLQEAEMLGINDDVKVMELSDLCDDIEIVNRNARTCSSKQ